MVEIKRRLNQSLARLHPKSTVKCNERVLIEDEDDGWMDE